MEQQQDPTGKPQGIIRTMQQDIDRAQGRGGDAFEDIASASPLPPQASADELLGMDIPVPDAPTPTPQASPVFEPAQAPAPQGAAPSVPTPPQPVTPQAPATPRLTDEELDALLPLDRAPSVQQQQPSAPAPDFGSVARRVTPMPETTSPIANQAPAALPMDDIAPVVRSGSIGPESAPTRAQGMATPPANLPIGGGPQLTPPTPQASPVFEPAQAPAPAPQPQPIPPFGAPPQQGLEEGEELPEQTPEELLGLGFDEEPAPMAPAAPSAMPQAPITPSAAELEKPVFVEEKSSFLSSRATLITAGGLFIAALAGTLAYFFFFATPEPAPIIEESANPPAQEGPIVPPSPLITSDRIDEVSITRLSTQTLQTALARVGEDDLQPGSITYLPVRLTETTSDGKEQYLTAQLFFTTLGVALPEEFLETIEPTFMLYAYGPGEEEETVCAAEGTSRTTCPGPRLGIILQARGGQEGNTAALVAAWTALDMSTLEPLILDEATLPTATIFQQSTYSGAQTENTGTIPVYYKNVPHSATTLNFAIAPGGKIVIGTSKNSLYAALDMLLEAE